MRPYPFDTRRRKGGAVPVAIIGQPFTFHALFLDADNQPVAVTGPTIKVFRFSPAGAEVVLTTSSMTAVSGDAGRYRYTMTVPTTLSPGDMLYATMQGVDPGTLELLLQQVSVSLAASQTTGTLVARFIP